MQSMGTMIHEIMHSLGFEHEHKRADQAKYLNIQCYLKGEDKSQYEPESDFNNTRFDIFSIMIYDFIKTNPNCSDPACAILGANGKVQRFNQLSPLNKLNLNKNYPPFFSNDYRAQISQQTNLYYCGRKVMQYHNIGDPEHDLTDGFCGPNNGPNCEACRTIQNDLIPKENSLGKKVWQGYSGMFYCGRFYGSYSKHHDGVCGPDNGRPCPECFSLIR